MTKKLKWLNKNTKYLRHLDKKYRKNLHRKKNIISNELLPVSKFIMALENYFFHYIRKYNNRSYPYFNFLHENNFKKIITSKIDKLIKIGDDIDTKYKKKKYIFSFDDGLKDHLFASNILKKKNILGIFL